LPVFPITSVSETIRKPPLAEAQSALGKQKIYDVEHGYLSHCRNSVKKKLLPMQNFTQIGQSAAKLWPKTIFKMAQPSTILNFKNVHI